MRTNWSRARRSAPGSAIALLLFTLLPAGAGAIEFELGLVTGAQQTGGVDTVEGDLDLAGGVIYGVSTGWRVQADGLIELSWWRQDSEASGNLVTGPVEFDVTIDTLEIGGLWETRPGKMRPFIAAGVGGTHVAGPDQGYGEAWNFSGSISGGVRFLFGEHTVLRLEGRGTGILLNDGGALGCAFPTGACSLRVTGSAIGAFSARLSLAARF